MAVRKRKIQANYLKIADAFELLGAGFTDLNESPSAQTTSKLYINQSSASQSITGYEWASEFTADQIVNEKAIDYIREIGELQKTGSDTETDYLIVDLDKPSAIEGSFRARKIRVAIAIDSFEADDGDLQMNGSFLGISDPILGTFNTSTKEFTEGFSTKPIQA